MFSARFFSLSGAVRLSVRQNTAVDYRIWRSFSQHAPRSVSWQQSTRPRIAWHAAFNKATQRDSRRQIGFGPRYRYQRFNQSSSTLSRLVQSRYFYYYMAGFGVVIFGVYTANLEEVPISHRRRFRIIPYEWETSTGEQMYQQTMQQYSSGLLPPSHPSSRMAQRVAKRLIPHSGLENESWEVHVIESPEMNAFVIPGGKIFVFSGILKVCEDDDGLAAVLSHEIAHNVAHHTAERMSQHFVWFGLAFVASLYMGIDVGISRMAVELALLNPGSRAQESEADYLGLLMMSEACYDPQAAVRLWANMEEIEKYQPPQWMSTHPSNHNRLEKMREWMPQAETKADESGCRHTRPHVSDFFAKANSSMST